MTKRQAASQLANLLGREITHRQVSKARNKRGALYKELLAVDVKTKSIANSILGSIAD